MAADVMCKNSSQGETRNYEEIQSQEFICKLEQRELGLSQVVGLPNVIPVGLENYQKADNIKLDSGEHAEDNEGYYQTMQGKFPPKRKLSLPAENNNKKFRGVGQLRKRRKTVEKLSRSPKFLLGGTNTDPLNLNSLADAEVSKVLNAETPSSSPLPEINKDPDPVIVPQDLRDPLKLNSDDGDETPSLTKIVGPRKRRRRNSLRAGKLEDLIEENADEDVEKSDVGVESDKKKNFKEGRLELSLSKYPVVDKIVSPVLPDTSQRMRKHKKKSEPSATVIKALLIEDATESKKEPKPKRTPEKHKTKRQLSAEERPLPKFREKEKLFQYGNYVGYYGYRNEQKDDVRLTYFKKEWFEDKSCLDIGCNTGHVTLFLAKEFLPRKIVGLDIDGKLINLARKNMRQCLEERFRAENRTGRGKFPESMRKTFGPLQDYSLVEVTSVKAKCTSEGASSSPPFPANVLFRCGNFVFNNDNLLQTQKEEYDTILSLSITKWIHLNWGDEGIKRFFKRAYLALRPGGRFILEPQAWPSYAKKKKMTETTYRNFYQIKFKPPNFKSYLLQEVGFSTCEVIGTPMNKSKGFRRPLLMFIKLTSKSPDVSPDESSHVRNERERHSSAKHRADKYHKETHESQNSFSSKHATSSSSRSSEHEKTSSHSRSEKHHYHQTHLYKPKQQQSSKQISTASKPSSSQGISASSRSQKDDSEQMDVNKASLPVSTHKEEERTILKSAAESKDEKASGQEVESDASMKP